MLLPELQSQNPRTLSACLRITKAVNLDRVEIIGESPGTFLFLQFAQGPGVDIPSNEDLLKTFCQFGPLKATETHLVKDNTSAQIVFVNNPDVVEALHSLEQNKPFGDTSNGIWSKPAVKRKTKIVCTIGPSTGTKEMIWELAEASMNVARLNMSHGDHASHQKFVDMVKEYNAQSEKDWDDVKFGVDNKVDFYAVSFVKDAEVVHELKSYWKSCDVDIHVIVKIESADSILNLHSIITTSDGAMVTRRDFGAELPMEEVPLLQEEIINSCRSMGKAVIVATNMLESMIVHPTPTRAEVSDIAIAVREGSDGIMLSGEIAHGQF